MNIVENKNYYMHEIDVKTAKDLIVKYHYSKKVVPNSKLHLGVFDKKTNKLVGVLQYGTPMNATKTPQKLVENTNQYEMYELNRMAMLDEAPKFSESQAIALSIKYIKKYKKNINWLLSFSDGKEGNVGTIYQATNWKYYGYRISDSFYDLDGEIMHAVQIWHKYKENNKSTKTTHEILYENYNNVSKIYSKQFIYIFPIDENIKVLLKEQPYPKKENEAKIIKQVFYKNDGIILNKKLILNYDIHIRKALAEKEVCE